MKRIETDVAVIGAGTAGLTAYRAVKSAGLEAVLIEGGPYGTTCARVGCMPSKLLIASAEAAHGAAAAADFGVRIDGAIRIDGRAIMARVKRERDRFVGFVLESVDQIPDADKVRGHAKFLSSTELQVDDHTVVHAGRTVIATGSSPVVPKEYEAIGDRAIVNDDVFAWDDLPRSVLVVGTGVIGLELGQALSRLGVRTRIIGRGDGLAGLSDPVVRDSLRAALQAELSLQLNSTVLGLRRIGDEVEVRHVEDGRPERTERFDYVLLATGRAPNLDLDLGKAGAKLDAGGMPVYDRETLQLAGLPIFIAGDVNGMAPLLHEAADDGHIAGGNAAAYPDARPGKRRAPMAVVFSDPQVAAVGLRFRDLPQHGVAIGEVDFKSQGRSRIMLKNRGRLRVYASHADGRLLGAEMAGPAMEHVAHLLAWAVQKKLTVPEMLAMPFYHPVVEEGLRTALRHAAMELKAAELERVSEGEQAVNNA
ncbi:MAG: dihydrolipoyl dehydrogenase [Alcaligenaceae bacterium]|nr:dihydrolipoyl dehydrogenase [Alcaligenaceae bacterium]